MLDKKVAKPYNCLNNLSISGDSGLAQGKGIMDAFCEHLNTVLVETFRSILKVEEKALQQTSKLDLSISELHLVEAVGRCGGEGRTISGIAKELGITLPSVTVAINKLMKKGFVEKCRCRSDGRSVRVTLTKLGQKAQAAHAYFHRRLVRSVAKELTSEEKSAMIKGMVKLNDFFKQKLNEMED